MKTEDSDTDNKDKETNATIHVTRTQPVKHSPLFSSHLAFPSMAIELLPWARPGLLSHLLRVMVNELLSCPEHTSVFTHRNPSSIASLEWSLFSFEKSGPWPISTERPNIHKRNNPRLWTQCWAKEASHTQTPNAQSLSWKADRSELCLGCILSWKSLRTNKEEVILCLLSRALAVWVLAPGWLTELST